SPAAPLCRRYCRIARVLAGADLERAAWLDLIPVSGRARCRPFLPLWPVGGARRRRTLFAAVDLAAARFVRDRYATPPALRPNPLAVGLPGCAADRVFHRDFAMEPYPLSLGGTRLPDADPLARQRDRPPLAGKPRHPPGGERDRGCCRARHRTLR